MNKIAKQHFPLAVAAITASLAGGTQAEDFMLEEIVVTAQKRAESLQDTPVAISAFQGDALQNMGVGSTQQLQAVTPTLTFNNRGAIAQPYIRGIGTTLSLLGLEPSIATYVDDQYYSRPAGNIMELPDIERIEVLKGPQGTLYGRNATGGAIRIVTKDPGEEFEGKIKLSVGNYDYYGLSAYVSGAVTDNLSANFSALVKQRDGFAENQVPGKHDLDTLDVETYRTKWVWGASDDVTVKWSLDYSRREDTAGSETIDITNSSKAAAGGALAASAIGGFSSVGKEQDKIYASADDDNILQMLNTSLQFDVALDGMNFSSISTYQDSRLETKAGDFDTSALRFADVSDAEENEAFSQEFQLVSDSDSALKWVAGTYFFQSEGDYQLTFDGRDLALVGNTTLVSPKSQLDTTAWALFGQATYDFNEQLSLTLGARYSEEKKEVESSGGSPALPGAKSEETWEKFTPKATLEYNTDVGMVYLTYSTGFKSGGFAYPFINAAGVDTTNAVDPENLDMWELGAKVDLLGNTLRLNAALYYYDYEDLQVNRNAGLGPAGIQIPVENAKGAEVTGLEVDVTWLPMENLTLTGGFNAMETEYTDYDNATPNVYNTAVFPGPVVAATAYDATGDDMTRAPDFSAFLALEYAFQVGDATMPLNLTYSYKGDYNFDLMPGTEANKIDELESDAYELINARLSYVPASEEWSVSLWGNNLTDEEYYDEVVTFATGVRATVAAPRTYGVDFTYNF